MALRDYLFHEEPGITLYCGDARKLWPLLDWPPHPTPGGNTLHIVGNPACDCLACVGALVLTDPPYGLKYESHHNSGRKGTWARWVRDENLPPIVGDERPIDPEPLLWADAAIIWGGQYIADCLPPTRCWLVWDKRDGIGPNNQADCEMAWTDLFKPARIYRHLWSGLLRAGEANVAVSEKLHPHQKPVELMTWAIEYAGTHEIVLDPYCGSGTTLLAAKRLNRHAIGIEIEPRYCEIAVKRLRQEVLPLVTP